MIPDGELLRRYAAARSEDAFAELVHRHVGLVYSAALRQVNGDAHLAQDVAQMVFADLARKAAALAHHEVLTGWLYTSTHFAAAKAVRTEQRRQAREQRSQEMHELLQSGQPDLDWEKLRPVLDAAMQKLSDSDREVILLRYFENRPFADIGERLRLSEDAARKRADRALEKLRALLCQRGISTAAALGAALSANAVQTVPAGLAAALTSATLAGAAATTSGLNAFQLMTMAKSQTAVLGGLALAGVLISVMVQRHELVKLRAENATLNQRASDLAQPSAETPDASVHPVQTVNSLPPDQFSELLRLRGESGQRATQISTLRADLAKARQEAAVREKAAKSYYPRSAWATAGNATPEAALESSQWRNVQPFLQAKGLSREGLTNLIKTQAPPELQARLLQELAEHSDAEVADEIAQGIEQFDKTDGIRIVNEQADSDDKMTLTFMIFTNHGTNDGWSRATVVRSGDGWTTQ